MPTMRMAILAFCVVAVDVRVALKCIEHVFSSTTDARRALREISIMRQCNHNNIIKLRPVLLQPAFPLAPWCQCKRDAACMARLRSLAHGCSQPRIVASTARVAFIRPTDHLNQAR